MGAAHEEECRDIPYFVTTENGKTMKQCACDKVFYVATDISTKDKTKADFIS